MTTLRSSLTFFLASAALSLIILANLSGANAPFFRNLFLSKLETDDGSQYYWTLYNFCSMNVTAGDSDITCTPSQAAYPYTPSEWSTNWQAVDDYSTGSKAAYGFLLLALILTSVSVVANIVLFFRRESIWCNISRIFSLVAVFTNLLAAIIEAGLHKNGSVNIASGNIYTAYVGRYMQVFLWIPVFVQFGAVAISVLMKDNYFEKVDLESEKAPRKYPFEVSKRSAL